MRHLVKYYRHETRFCYFALLCFMITTLMMGCDNADNNNTSPPPKKPLVVVTDPKSAEEVVFSTTNAVRAEHGKPPLKHDNRLSELARAYSQLMLENNFFAHVTPDGKTLSDRFAAFQIRYHAIAENIARYEGVFQTIPTREVVEGWLSSPGHRVNLLDEKGVRYTHLGIGIAIGKSKSSSEPVYYYTQLFWLP
ncbi:CAP domain-containing protein [Candidatus Poribacteria bacterium]|nr:CAP domain-containing protein [Candidatus Poribacteria bacterium]